MINKMFINLPVRDLDRSAAFFKALGFKFNQNFSSKNAVCVVVNKDVYVMLLREDLFKKFSRKKVSETTDDSEVIISFAVDSPGDIDTLVERALLAGGTASEPYDYGWMKGWGFSDPDGHQWEIMYLIENRIPVNKGVKYEEEAFAEPSLWY